MTATCFAQETNVSEYIKLAEQGDAEAQCNLGECYAKGDGVPQSESEALIWFRKSAKQGYAPAQYNLGYCHVIGYGGVFPSYSEAVIWFWRAAEQ